MIGSVELFHFKCKRLAEAGVSDDPAVVLEGAAAFRLLILDHLMFKINESYKLRFIFTIGWYLDKEILAINALVAQMPGVTEITSVGDAFDPKIIPKPGTPVSLDEFLSTPVLSLKGDLYTVLDVTKAAANKEGGVHYEANPPPKEALLRQFSQEIFIGNQPGIMRTLKAIYRVAHQGLLPLIEATT